jgi:hypothetical protein
LNALPFYLLAHISVRRLDMEFWICFGSSIWLSAASSTSFESRSRGQLGYILRRGYFLLELQQNRAVTTLFTMEAHPAIFTKRWLDCFVREASYAMEVLWISANVSCHSHFTSCPGLLGDFSVDAYSARTMECSMLRIVPRVSYFATDSFFRFPCLAAPYGRSWAKSARLSNVQFIVGG